jgi:hypothetical protein
MTLDSISWAGWPPDRAWSGKATPAEDTELSRLLWRLANEAVQARSGVPIEWWKFSDYPANVDARATQTGFQFRTGSWGNLNVDPVTGTLYATWTDNRDGAHDVANPVTDTNVFLAWSDNAGASWHQPVRVTAGPTDKWFPWVAARGGRVWGDLSAGERQRLRDIRHQPGHLDQPRYQLELSAGVDRGLGSEPLGLVPGGRAGLPAVRDLHR